MGSDVKIAPMSWQARRRTALSAAAAPPSRGTQQALSQLDCHGGRGRRRGRRQVSHEAHHPLEMRVPLQVQACFDRRWEAEMGWKLRFNLKLSQNMHSCAVCLCCAAWPPLRIILICSDHAACASNLPCMCLARYWLHAASSQCLPVKGGLGDSKRPESPNGLTCTDCLCWCVLAN